MDDPPLANLSHNNNNTSSESKAGVKGDSRSSLYHRSSYEPAIETKESTNLLTKLNLGSNKFSPEQIDCICDALQQRGDSKTMERFLRQHCNIKDDTV